MANKREISVAISLTAKMENIQQNLTKLRNDLSKLSLPQSVVNDFSSLFSNMEKEIDKLVSKTASGQLKLVDSKDAIKSIEKIDSLYSLLIQKYESKGIGAAALKEDQQAMNALTSAIKEYGEQTRGIERDQAKLSREVERQTKKQQELLEIQKEQKVVSEAELSAQRAAEKQAAKDARAAEKELLEARRLLDEKIALSAGKYTKEDITRKNSNLRKTDAYKNYKKASENAAIANKNKKDIDAIGATMVTLAQQKEALQQVENAILKAENNLKQFNETQKAIAENDAFAKIKEELLSLEGIDFSKYDIDISAVENADDLQKVLEKLAIQVQNNSKALDKNFTSSLKTTEKELDGVQGEVKETAEALEELEERSDAADAMTNRIKQFLGISGAAQVMRASLRDAMQTITELDAIMTEMAVVTDLTVGDYWDQLPEYSKQASELGVSINSAYEAATLYYQQGLKGNEVTKISAETLKMAKIAGLDAADATDKMTAALRGFNMEIDEASAQRVSDVYSQLAAITAADTKEIANAMTKTASIAHSAGMEFETTAAFLAQIVETTRESAETAGTAMKTVIARFQELKKSPDEIGEVDGEIVDANAIEAALRTVGVSLRDTNGQFRELDDVFLELSSKWDSLDKNTQRYIATIAAGSRQQSRFIAMMSDYGRTQELVNAANNSAGASNRQFEKTLESLSSKIEKLKNAWHEFTMGILESDLIKKGVDILTKFLEIINKATSSLGSMGNAISKIIGTFALFKVGQKIFEKFKEPIYELFASVTNEAGNQGYLAGKNWATEAKRGAEEALGISEEKTDKEDEQSAPVKNKRVTFKEQWETVSADRSEYKKELAKLNEMKQQYGGKKAQKQILETSKKNVGNSTDPRIQAILKEREEQLKSYEKQEQKVLAASQKAWKDTGKAISSVGAGISTIGMGLSAIGGILSELGLEEMGEIISGIGQGVMILGGALQALPAIIQLITTVSELAGITMTAAFGWVALIVVAVVGLGALLIKVVKDIQANSPEGKLKAAREEAEQAAEAANKLTESYNNLANSIDGLDDKYKSLDNLTRGTKEWNSAVQDINNSVLELIEEYPELAEFMESKNGVLTLGLDDEQLQNVIIKAETASVVAQNTARVANAQAELASKQAMLKNFADLKGDAVFQYAYKEVEESTKEIAEDMYNANVQAGTFDSPAAQLGAWLGSLLAPKVAGQIAGTQERKEIDKILELAEGDEEKYAKALESGLIYKNAKGQYEIDKDRKAEAEELGLTDEGKMQDYLQAVGPELKALGEELKANSAALDSQYAAIVDNTKQLMDFSNVKDEDKNQVYNYVDSLLTGDDYARMVKEEKDKIKGDLTGEQIDKLVVDIFGTGATYDSSKKQILSSSGEVLSDEADMEYLKNLAANQAATQRLEAAGESIPGMIEQIKKALSNVSDETLERLFSNKEGLALSQEDIAEIQRYILPDATKLYNLFESWGPEMQDVFGEFSDLWDYIASTKDAGEKAFGTARSILEGAKYGTGQQFQGVTAEQATSLAQVAAQASLTVWGQGNNFLTAFNALVGSSEFTKLTKDQQNMLINGIAGMSEDVADRGDWESLQKTLVENGIKITGLDEFLTTAIDAVSSTYTDAYLQNMGVGENLIKFYQNAVTGGDKNTLKRFHETFKDWKADYDLANSESAKAEHELITQAAEKLAEQYNEQIEQQEKLIEGQESVYDAVNEASSKIVDNLQKQIEESRQIRENTEKEQELGDKYAQLAYLSQDTSGASSLEVMRLEKEIADAEQDYMDSLVDQAISELADANARAEEQRSKQIELARAQLNEQKDASDFYGIAKELVVDAEGKIKTGIPIEETQLGKIFKDTKFASEYESALFWTKLSENISNAIGEAPPPDDGSNSGNPPGKTNLPPIEFKFTIEDGKNNLLNVSGGVIKNDAIHAIKYATGGLADFTGPAWLDGTPSKPEYVLNAAQTERFFSLIDVLEGYDTKEKTNKQKNEISVDVDINVENISSDYDVEQMANKIRSMLCDDAMYRNVNNINLAR